MSDFRLSESTETEEYFRSSYRQIRETSCRCCSGMGNEDWCENVCHFLIAGDPEANTDGYPTVFGLDCDVAIPCWGGDIDDVTPEVYCKDCARIRARREYEERREAEIQYQQQAAAAKRQRAEEERQKRTVKDFWISLPHLEFELQCAKLFRGLGFNAETTGRTNDGGIDILLGKDGKRGAVQCKAWAEPCGVAELRDFYGALHVEGMTFGYFVARSGFTPRAKLLLQKMPLIKGWTLDELVEHAMRSGGDAGL